MTEEEADKILSQGYGSTGAEGTLRVHEALLVKDGVPEPERAAILERITLAYIGRAVDQNWRA
jgi:hypothetical protein